MPQTHPLSPAMSNVEQQEVTPDYILAVQPKLRPFDQEEPELWFLNAEFQFETATPKITTSQTKFRHAVTAIPPKVQRQVKTILLQPPADPYKALKYRLCTVFKPSQAEIAS